MSSVQLISPDDYAKRAASELITAAPKSDAAIMGLAQQILQRQIPPQNSEIWYGYEDTDITARFSQLGHLTSLSRCDKGLFFNHNFNASFPSKETPGPLAKYEWTEIQWTKIQPKENININVGAVIGIAGLTAIACAGPMIPIAAVTTLAALPVLVPVAGVILVGAAVPIIAATAITAAVAIPVLAVTAVAAAPLIVLGALFSAL